MYHCFWSESFFEEHSVTVYIKGIFYFICISTIYTSTIFSRSKRVTDDADEGNNQKISPVFINIFLLIETGVCAIIYTAIWFFVLIDPAQYKATVPRQFSCMLDFKLETGETGQIVYFFYRELPDLLNVGLSILVMSFFLFPICNVEIIAFRDKGFGILVFFLTNLIFGINLV